MVQEVLQTGVASKDEILAMDREIQADVARATAAAQAAAFPPAEDAFAHVFAGGDLWPK
jgi:TPP-dependent pyruvate/acetoin dehydrogenase alpha subunit